MKKWFYVFLVAIITFSCADPAKMKTEQRLESIEARKGSDSLQKIMDTIGKPVSNVIIKEAELLGDSVSFYRYGLQDTLITDVNCDGFIDRIYFSQQSTERHLNLLNGKEKKQKVFGLDLPVKGETEADYSWVDFWGITKDTSTWEMIVIDSEIAGSRNVTLNCPSIVLRKAEVGGGIITFRGTEFVWVHQAD